MSTTARPDASERFALNAASFEKFLAAAWVLQCQRDEALLDLQYGPREINAAPPVIRKSEPDLDSQSFLEGATRCLASLPDAVVQSETQRRQPDVYGALPELQQLSLTLQEHPEDASVLQLETAEPWVGETPGASEAVELGRSTDFQAAFLNSYRAFKNYRHTFRIRFSLPEIRRIAVAVPILGLAILSGWLIFATWRHESNRSAQATEQTGAAPVEGAVTETSQPPAAVQNVAHDVGVAVETSSQLSLIPALQLSHLRVTDAATDSTVRELSRYEIRGLRRRAKYGDSSAAFALGMAYETGHHLHQSCREAARWVTKAAVAGDAAAQYNLGLRYRSGDGVHANSAQSRKWLRKAARRNPNAKLALKLLASR
jgi:Sel1 repeat-containing protein